MIASPERDMKHSRGLSIINVIAVSRQKARIFSTSHTRADHLWTRCEIISDVMHVLSWSDFLSHMRADLCAIDPTARCHDCI